MTSRTPSRRTSARLLVVALGIGACTTTEDGPVSPGLQAAKGGGGITVTAADPAFGNQGESGKQVRVLGSGFANGDQASWQRNGVADPKIQVLSTQFVNSSELVATINIAPDASLAFYDIAVLSPGRKGGIGTTLFEVTQATAVEGTSLIRGVNENGEMTGIGPVFWSPSGGLEIVAASGSGWDISDDGLTLVGGNESPSGNAAVTWTRSGTGWVESVLPRDPAATAGHAVAVASDPTTGAAIAIGGIDTYTPKRNTVLRLARLWLRSGATWQRVVLPGTSSAFVNDLSANLIAVGYVGTGAAVWEPDGVGGWTLTVIGPATSVGPKFAEARAVNRAGTVIVGVLNSVAVYWQRVGSTWSSAIALPGGCGTATGIDELGRILLRSCSLGPSWRTFTSAVVEPPYSSATITFLGGFGDRTDGPQAWAMSSQGTWVVGSAKLKNSTIGAYWNVF